MKILERLTTLYLLPVHLLLMQSELLLVQSKLLSMQSELLLMQTELLSMPSELLSMQSELHKAFCFGLNSIIVHFFRNYKLVPLHTTF